MMSSWASELLSFIIQASKSFTCMLFFFLYKALSSTHSFTLLPSSPPWLHCLHPPCFTHLPPASQTPTCVWKLRKAWSSGRHVLVLDQNTDFVSDFALRL